MSKELVISANRHETRVAMVEDDQVVEVYHQRENEYSLAGSIHKGRVTRVLPGMQSAFVDIGLDRDAFLYVSDFFEDNEEYDKIVTSVEEKVLKLDRPAPRRAPRRPCRRLRRRLAAAETAGAVTPRAAAPVPAAPRRRRPAPARSRRPARERRRNGRRRSTAAATMAIARRPRAPSRARRSRKERGGRRRTAGIASSIRRARSGPEPRREAAPEAGAAPPAEPAPSAPTRRADDFFVLPGESLAKYRGGRANRWRRIRDEPSEDAAEIGAGSRPQPSRRSRTMAPELAAEPRTGRGAAAAADEVEPPSSRAAVGRGAGAEPRRKPRRTPVETRAAAEAAGRGTKPRAPREAAEPRRRKP